jgi:REP element-mobilizing transposase RayT
MARQKRIEFADATYHCMARGNRREDIAFSDKDRDDFSKLLGELVERTGWEMFAWVLMSNHYHLVFKTPQPNLVEGMRWLQNTWTKRMNARHGLWGHLFGGRYKSVLVEGNEHLSVLIDYVHLNPYRAGLVDLKRGLETYQWSSLGDYMKPPRKRCGWVRADLGFVQRHYDGARVADRRRYLAHLEEITRNEKGIPSAPGEAERTLQSRLSRGWYFGGESFREKMLEKLSASKKPEGGKKRYRRESGYVGEQMRDHGEREARRIIRSGLRLAGVGTGQLKSLPKGDWRKRVIGYVVRKHTAVRVAWVAEELRMGVATRAGVLTSHPPTRRSWGSDWNVAANLLKELERDYEKAENLD